MDSGIIGKYFYQKNSELTDIQVQKLTYYAYAWFLVCNKGKNKLFEEQPEAWVHGPVFRMLYNKMKEKSFYAYEELNLEEHLVKFLEIIYNVYSKYSGNELENLTHSELPWQSARKRGGVENIYNAHSTESIIDEDILAWGTN